MTTMVPHNTRETRVPRLTLLAAAGGLLVGAVAGLFLFLYGVSGGTGRWGWLLATVVLFPAASIGLAHAARFGRTQGLYSCAAVVLACMTLAVWLEQVSPPSAERLQNTLEDVDLGPRLRPSPGSATDYSAAGAGRLIGRPYDVLDGSVTQAMQDACDALDGQGWEVTRCLPDEAPAFDPVETNFGVSPGYVSNVVAERGDRRVFIVYGGEEQLIAAAQ